MFKINHKDTRTIPIAIVNFEQVNADWERVNFIEWIYCIISRIVSV